MLCAVVRFVGGGELRVGLFNFVGGREGRERGGIIGKDGCLGKGTP